MKSRILLVLLSLTLTLSLFGCQESSAKTETQPVAIEENLKEQSKQKQPAPPRNVSTLNWEEPCSVELATSAAKRAFGELGLSDSSKPQKTRTVRTRDPKTGRMLTKQVPIATGNSVYSISDELSGVVKGKSVAGTEFIVHVSLIPPESCHVEIIATGPNPPEILKKHTAYIQKKISEAIKNPVQEEEVTGEPLPYPETMVFNRPVNEIYKVVYNWGRTEKFHQSGGNSDDKYYQYVEYTSESNIRFIFQIRLVDENRTKLKLKVSGYEEKDEFNMILKSLMDALQELKGDRPESKAATTYTETKILDYPISAVYETFVSWVNEKHFSTRSRASGGDAFYKYMGFQTGGGIEFQIQMRLIDTQKTKLEMTVNNQEGREEFPMILKSLEDTLTNIEVKETIVDKAVQEPPRKSAPKN